MSKTTFHVDAHIPHGSGDAEWRIVGPNGVVFAIVDPHMEIADPSEVAHAICEAMRAHADTIA